MEKYSHGYMYTLITTRGLQLKNHIFFVSRLLSFRAKYIVKVNRTHLIII